MSNEEPVSLRDLFDAQQQLRWEAHTIKHDALARALEIAALQIDHETVLRWQSHHDQHLALDHARDQSATSLNGRLESMNEFRTQLAQQASTFITREAVAEKEAAHSVVHDHARERIAELEQWRAAVDAKFWALGIGFTIFTFAINVITRYLFPTTVLP